MHVCPDGTRVGSMVQLQLFDVAEFYQKAQTLSSIACRSAYASELLADKRGEGPSLIHRYNSPLVTEYTWDGRGLRMDAGVQALIFGPVFPSTRRGC